LPVYLIQQNPKIVAKQLRKEFYPEFNAKPNEFLRSLISKLAEKNILVFEFVETWNKKDIANINGFFLNPNVIVLKRQQNSFRREIFTLIHELGHYLLNEEEVEQLDIQSLASHKISAIERWCNDFAYYLLVGKYDSLIEDIDKADGSNDYYFETIESISKNTHLSKIALFTRLLFKNKLSRKNYNFIKSDFEEKFRLKQDEQDEKERKKELDKLKGIKSGGASPKPIQSPLRISTIQTAFYEGVISELDVCGTVNIKPNKIENFIQ